MKRSVCLTPLQVSTLMALRRALSGKPEGSGALVSNVREKFLHQTKNPPTSSTIRAALNALQKKSLTMSEIDEETGEEHWFAWSFIE